MNKSLDTNPAGRGTTTTDSTGLSPASSCPERGSSSAASVGLVAVLMVLAATIAGLGGVIAANHRAATAADLAALAAADTARGLNSGDPCTVASEVALANGAELTGCSPHPHRPGTVDVRVAVDVRGVFGFVGSAQGLARAGPPPNTPGPHQH